MKKQGAFIFLDAASTAAAAAAVFNPPHPVYQAIRMNTSSTVNITCLAILTVTIENLNRIIKQEPAGNFLKCLCIKLSIQPMQM